MNFLLPEWLLALTLTLFALDIFLATEVLSWCGIITLASYLTWRIGPTWKWAILVFLLAIPVAAIFYYTLVKLVRPLLQHGSPKEIMEKLKGARGTIHFVNDKPMFRWNDDELWSVDSEMQVQEGDRVVVTSIKDGVLTVSPIK